MLHPIMPAVRNHHERRDGSGYPDKMVAEDISLVARIVAKPVGALPSNGRARRPPAGGGDRVKRTHRDAAGERLTWATDQISPPCSMVRGSRRFVHDPGVYVVASVSSMTTSLGSGTIARPTYDWDVAAEYEVADDDTPANLGAQSEVAGARVPDELHAIECRVDRDKS